MTHDPTVQEVLTALDTMEEDAMLEQPFGRLIVEECVQGPTKRVRYRCRCACGNTTVVLKYNLKNGHTQSCGCAQREATSRATKTHGMRQTRLYTVWHRMIQRCEDPRDRSYKNYGARGITVCARWRNSFVAFRDDMGEPPGDTHSIDRYPDRDGPYMPGNCRWATAKQQANNKRDNVLLTHEGQTKTLTEWAAVLGVKMNTLWRRYVVAGWSAERTLTTPILDTRLALHGESHTLRQWAIKTGIKPGTLWYRTTIAGWSLERAISTPIGETVP